MTQNDRQQIHWFNDPNLIRNLRDCVIRGSRGNGTPFKTIRLGAKWGSILVPDMIVEITIGNPNEKIETLGECDVCSVMKTKIMWLRSDDLVQNIGAKTQQGILSSMQKVYAPQQVSMDSIVTVIELIPRKKEE
jgi:hypothetical protein